MHSSGYADAQNAGNFGSADGGMNTSFEKRRELDANRQNIQKYGNSQVAQQHNFRDRAITFEEAIAREKTNSGFREIYGDSERRQEPRGDAHWYDIGKPNNDDEKRRARGYGRTSSAQLHEKRAIALSYRQAQAERFSGGVKTYRGGPKKFSGGTGINRRMHR